MKKSDNQMFKDLCLFRDRGEIAIAGLVEILNHRSWFAKTIASRTLKKCADFYKKF